MSAGGLAHRLTTAIQYSMEISFIKTIRVGDSARVQDTNKYGKVLAVYETDPALPWNEGKTTTMVVVEGHAAMPANKVWIKT